MKTIFLNKTTEKEASNLYGWIFVFFSSLLFALISVKIIAPEVKSNAATTTDTIGPYSLSMSTDNSVAINFVPTSTATVYQKSTSVGITNTCPYGAKITMSSATTSNTLSQTVNGTTYTIPATTSTSLDTNSWGYSITNAVSWQAVPVSSSPVTIYNASAQATNHSIPLIFGIKADNNLPSGAYTGNILYTLTPNSNCYSYSITWDMDGGTKKSGVTYPTSKSWGETINLSTLTPTRSGYKFGGWSAHGTTFTGSETAADINPSKYSTVTIKAIWKEVCSDCTQTDIVLSVGEDVEFAYTGKCVQGTVKKAGYYKLEAWGGEGGKSSHGVEGGKGGYSYGTYKMTAEEDLFACSGGSGGAELGGFNGGGGGSTINSDSAAGGGAAHIATASGTLKSLESNKSAVLLVAGGGGASGCSNTYGGDGGGLTGTAAVDTHTDFGGPGGPGTQTAGGAGGTNSESGSFGQGGGTGLTQAWPGGGGGGGWYGGGAGGNMSGGGGAGGGGSGYVNPILTNAATIAGDQTFVSPTGGTETGHSGSSYTRVTYLGTSI